MKLRYVFVFLIAIPFLGISQTLKELNKPIVSGLDEIAPFSEGLAAVKKGDQWGFINEKGQLVIDFRKDLVWNEQADAQRSDVEGIRYPKFKEGLCMISGLSDEGIPLYGFMNKEGKTVIEPEYVNITQFEDGNAIGVFAKKTFSGQNEFQLKIFRYTFTEVLVNTVGEIQWPISERDNIIMSKSRYRIPGIRAHLIAKNLLAVKTDDNLWEVRKLDL